MPWTAFSASHRHQGSDGEQKVGEEEKMGAFFIAEMASSHIERLRVVPAFLEQIFPSAASSLAGTSPDSGDKNVSRGRQWWGFRSHPSVQGNPMKKIGSDHAMLSVIHEPLQSEIGTFSIPGNLEKHSLS